MNQYQRNCFLVYLVILCIQKDIGLVDAVTYEGSSIPCYDAKGKAQVCFTILFKDITMGRNLETWVRVSRETYFSMTERMKASTTLILPTSC